jgi:hypothetical protein
LFPFEKLLTGIFFRCKHILEQVTKVVYIPQQHFLKEPLNLHDADAGVATIKSIKSASDE